MWWITSRVVRCSSHSGRMFPFGNCSYRYFGFARQARMSALARDTERLGLSKSSLLSPLNSRTLAGGPNRPAADVEQRGGTVAPLAVILTKRQCFRRYTRA
jgi:hypothetical protein